jgi:hypothetical protein
MPKCFVSVIYTGYYEVVMGPAQSPFARLGDAGSISAPTGQPAQGLVQRIMHTAMKDGDLCYVCIIAHMYGREGIDNSVEQSVPHLCGVLVVRRMLAARLSLRASSLLRMSTVASLFPVPYT